MSELVTRSPIELFWTAKNMTRNGQNSRPAETDPYVVHILYADATLCKTAKKTFVIK